MLYQLAFPNIYFPLRRENMIQHLLQLASPVESVMFMLILLCFGNQGTSNLLTLLIVCEQSMSQKDSYYLALLQQRTRQLLQVFQISLDPQMSAVQGYRISLSNQNTMTKCPAWCIGIMPCNSTSQQTCAPSSTAPLKRLHTHHVVSHNIRLRLL